MFGLAFFTMATVSSVYRVVEAGLNPLQLLLVGAALEGSTFLAEVPTGIVADVYSRRLSVIIGMVLIGCGFVIEGLFPAFAPIVLAQVVWGVGYTFTSGAHEAWLADEIGEERLTAAYLRGSQALQLGSLAGIGLSVLLGSADLALPLIAGGVVFVLLGAALALLMPETAFHPTPLPDRNSFGKMADTFRAGVGVVRARRVLMLIMAISVVYGLASEGVDRLRDAHFLEEFTFPGLGSLDPIVWFGIIEAGGMGLGILANEVVRRRFGTGDPRRVVLLLAALNALLAAAMVMFALAAGFAMALGAVWTVYLLRRTTMPLFLAWTNQGLDPASRATVLSIRSQADAFGQIAGGPLVGLLATVISLRAGIAAAGLALVPVLALYLAALRLARGVGAAGEPLPTAAPD